MTASLREAADQAIEALQCFIDGYENPMETREAIEALRAALALPDAAPVAMRYRLNGDMQWQYTENEFQATPPCEIQHLYTAPQPEAPKAVERVPLTYRSTGLCCEIPLTEARKAAQ